MIASVRVAWDCRYGGYPPTSGMYTGCVRWQTFRVTKEDGGKVAAKSPRNCFSKERLTRHGVHVTFKIAILNSDIVCFYVA